MPERIAQGGIGRKKRATPGQQRSGHAWVGYLTFLPAMVVPSFPCPEFAVANTLGVSFFGFLVSLLPLFFSLDISSILSLPGKLPRARAGAQDNRGGPLDLLGGTCRGKMGVRGGEDKRGEGWVDHLPPEGRVL